MKKMKTLSMLVILALVMSLLAGCGGDSKSTGRPCERRRKRSTANSFQCRTVLFGPGIWQQFRQYLPKGYDV